MMRRDGLPGLRELADWVSVLEWVSAAERTEASLFTLATLSHKSPAVAYRVVKRLTGLTWVRLKRRGSPWALRLFVRRCQALS
jgi:DNA-binding IclR family transcriptional regulator